MVETRGQKRRKIENEQLIDFEKLKDEERCKNCDETLVREIVTFDDPELLKKINWEYDMEEGDYFYNTNTQLIMSDDPDYAMQEFCLNCHHNWVVGESEETFLHDLGVKMKANKDKVVVMD